MEDHKFCVSDSSQFDCRGRYSVLIFVMAKALFFSPSLRYAVYLHSVLHQHFLYHMYIRERSGSVVECLTGDREAASSSLTGVTALCH